MVRQLPGLYWDHEKQRYFPLPKPTHDPIAQPETDAIATKRCRNPYQEIRSVLRTAHKDGLIHQLQSSQVLLTDKVTRTTVPTQGRVSAFQSLSHNGSLTSFVGDTLGWFYSSATDGWQRQFHLSSEISTIGISGSTCVATSFGPECKILYLHLDSPIDQGMQMWRIDNRMVHDVWTADLFDSRLVLGAGKQAVVIDDIAACASLRRLPTQSDVFALAQRQNLVYAGLRNGGIIRFDTRVPRPGPHPLFGSGTQGAKSVTALKHLRGYQLIASFIDGGISAFDLRFPIQTPFMTFSGNVNSYSVKLPLVTDQHEKLLFAAGQDNKIRLWSLMTGGPTLGLGAADQTAFQHPFEHRVAALQVVEEREGMCLWAASGQELCKYSLGQRSRMGV